MFRSRENNDSDNQFTDIHIPEIPDCERRIEDMLQGYKEAGFPQEKLTVLKYIYKRLLKLFFMHGIAAALENKIRSGQDTIYAIDLGCYQIPSYIPLRILLNHLSDKISLGRHIKIRFVGVDKQDISLCDKAHLPFADEVLICSSTDASNPHALVENLRSKTHSKFIQNGYDLLFLRAPNPQQEEGMQFSVGLLGNIQWLGIKPTEIDASPSICFVSCYTDFEAEKFQNLPKEMDYIRIKKGAKEVFKHYFNTCLTRQSCIELPYRAPIAIRTTSSTTGEHVIPDTSGRGSPGQEGFSPDCFSLAFYFAQSSYPCRLLKKPEATSSAAASLPEPDPIITAYLKANQEKAFFIKSADSNEFLKALREGIKKSPPSLSIALRKAVYIGNIAAVTFLLDYPNYLDPNAKNSKGNSAFNLLEEATYDNTTKSAMRNLLNQLSTKIATPLTM